MKKVAIIAGLAGVLLFSNTALADETAKDEHSGHGTTQIQPAAKQEPAKSTTPVQSPAATATHEEHNMTPEEHQNMSTTTNTSTTATTDEHATMTSEEHASHEGTTDSHEEGEESSSGGHGGHENVVETPPNIPVLTTFGAINAAFILFGVWNKWFRKKEVLA